MLLIQEQQKAKNTLLNEQQEEIFKLTKKLRQLSLAEEERRSLEAKSETLVKQLKQKEEQYS